VTKFGGSVVLLGVGPPQKAPLDVLMLREIDLISSLTYAEEKLPNGKAMHTFDLALQLMLEQDLSWLVTHTFKLSEFPHAVNAAEHKRESKAIKIVLTP